ncbi:MAG: Ycf48-like protein [Luteibacter sp.]|uniref:WD40/YVTN/BNR-like repeat-containing protein n=1 Tax=Luteibacter sp. TaxID=1886636 RepID=UPI00137F4CD5|nr:YCF48-related protein [Luteibacter sp.]KAF1005059.1 MAG: Ycf48-like protein [Luteibacter sp.]
MKHGMGWMLCAGLSILLVTFTAKVPAASAQPPYPHCKGVRMPNGSGELCKNLFTPLDPNERTVKDLVADTATIGDRGHTVTAYTVPGTNTGLANLKVVANGDLIGLGGPGYRIVRITKNGHAWHIVDHFEGAGEWARDVAFADDRRWFAIGSDGRMLRSQDGGEYWESVNRVLRLEGDDALYGDLHYDGSGYGVAFADTAHGVAVGEGRLLRTADGGQTWTRVPFPGTGIALQQVRFVDPAHGWAVGTQGTVLHTTDAGAHWTPVSLGDAGVHLMGLSFASPTHGCMGGDLKVWCTVDGGTTWRASRVVLPKGMDARPDIGITRIDMRDDRQGWFVTRDGWIFSSKDGGTTWAPWLNVTADGKLHDVELWGLAFANGMYWAAGTGARAVPEKNSASLSMRPLLLSWKP